MPTVMPQKQNTKNKRRKYTTPLKASLSYVAPHKHTGHRLPHKHTSHGILLLLLIAGGILLLFSLASLNAAGLTGNGGIAITAIVPGAPPITGAIITAPLDKSSVKQALLTVSGTCPGGTLVSVYNNGLPSASSMCAGTDTFNVTVQLIRGNNTLQAQNYDALNQAGPVTGQIGIQYAPDVPPTVVVPAAVNKPADISVVPSIQTVVVAQPADHPCFDDPTTTPDSNILTLVTPCITRNIFVGQKLNLPVNFWGGLEPYSLSIDWGDQTDAQFFSFSSKGRQTLDHTYQAPKVKNISLQLADATGLTYQTRSVADIIASNTTTNNSAGAAADSSTSSLTSTWVEASVPLYWAAVALFLGFWVGDLFRRFFATTKRVRRARA